MRKHNYFVSGKIGLSQAEKDFKLSHFSLASKDTKIINCSCLGC